MLSPARIPSGPRGSVELPTAVVILCVWPRVQKARDRLYLHMPGAWNLPLSQAALLFPSVVRHELAWASPAAVTQWEPVGAGLEPLSRVGQ